MPRWWSISISFHLGNETGRLDMTYRGCAIFHGAYYALVTTISLCVCIRCIMDCSTTKARKQLETHRARTQGRGGEGDAHDTRLLHQGCRGRIQMGQFAQRSSMMCVEENCTNNKKKQNFEKVQQRSRPLTTD